MRKITSITIVLLILSYLTACEKRQDIQVELKKGQFITSIETYQVKKLKEKFNSRPNFDEYTFRSGKYYEFYTQISVLPPLTYFSVEYKKQLGENFFIKEFYYTLDNKKYEIAYNSNPKFTSIKCLPFYFTRFPSLKRK